MKFFLDSASIDEIREALEWGSVDGVVIRRQATEQKRSAFQDVVQLIASITPGPVAVEVAAGHCDQILAEARECVTWGNNVVVTIPLSVDSVKAVNQLTQEGIRTNMTGCFSSVQALLAAKAGATYVSLSQTGLSDESMKMARETRTIFDTYGFQTQIVTADLLRTQQVRDAALAGAHIAVISVQNLRQLMSEGQEAAV